MKRRFTILWILIGLFVLFAFLYLPNLSHLAELWGEEGRIKKELSELDTKIARLEEEKKLLQTDLTYLEKVIREELGLVRPGEMVYKLVPEKQAKPVPKAQAPTQKRSS